MPKRRTRKEMNIKYAGILLIFITLSMAGRYKALAVKKEVDSLKDLIDAVIDNKILLKSERKRSCEITADIKEKLRFIQNKEVVLITNGLISKIGTTSLEGQLLLFDGCCERLNNILIRLEEKSYAKKKLYSSLGVILGAFAAVMLV